MNKSLVTPRYKAFSNSYTLLILGALTSLIVLTADVMYLDISLYKVSPLNFEVAYLIRTLLIMLSSLFFVASVLTPPFSKKELNNVGDMSEIWSNWGNLALGGPRYNISIPVKKLILLAIMIISLFSLFLLIFFPRTFSTLQSEGYIVESFSAIFYFIAAGLFIYLFKMFRKLQIRTYVIITLVFAIVFFTIGMEEVSWFQRVLSIDTPGGFEGNSQSELNLHNFKTDIFENLYFFSAFIFLIVLPFVNEKTGFNNKFKDLSFFIPSQFVLLASVLAFTYNYNLWNIFFTQLSFFITLFILIHYDWSSKRSGNNTILLPVLVTVFMVTQAFFFTYGASSRSWNDIHEYKEFFIPLALLIYSIETVIKAKKI